MNKEINKPYSDWFVDDDDTFIIPEYSKPIICLKCGSNEVNYENYRYVCRKCRIVFSICPKCQLPAYSVSRILIMKNLEFKCSNDMCGNEFAKCFKCAGYADYYMNNNTYLCRRCIKPRAFAICPTCEHYAYKNGKDGWQGKQRYICQKKICVPLNCYRKNLHFYDCTFKKALDDRLNKVKNEHFLMCCNNTIHRESNKSWEGSHSKDCHLYYCRRTCGRSFVPSNINIKKQRNLKFKEARLRYIEYITNVT
jgi:hypothetical protein